MNSPDLFIFRRMDMAADDAITFLVAGEILEQFLIFIHKANCGLHLGLHSLAEGEILLAAPRTPEVIDAIHL